MKLATHPSITQLQCLTSILNQSITAFDPLDDAPRHDRECNVCLFVDVSEIYGRMYDGGGGCWWWMMGCKKMGITIE